MTDRVKTRQQQMEEHQKLARKYGLMVGNFKLTDATYKAPVSDNVKDWPPLLQLCAYEERYAYHADVYAHLSMGKGPYYCAMCQPLKDRPRGWRVFPCWACWWEQWGYEQALDKARAISKHRWVDRAPRPFEVFKA